MPSILGLEIGRKRNQMQDQVNSMVDTLKKAGQLVNTGLETASRHDELAALDEFIRSPLTSLPDKIEYIDSLICRNLQWGMGRTEKFWDVIFNTWRELYTVWLIFNSYVEMEGIVKYHVSYTEKKVAVATGKDEFVSHDKVLMADTVMFLIMNVTRYSDVVVTGKVKTEARKEKYDVLAGDNEQYKQDAYDFGREVVLQAGWMALNYIFHPDHVNPKHILVISGMPQPQGFNPQGPAAASDFAGGKQPPPQTSVPSKIEKAGQ